MLAKGNWRSSSINKNLPFRREPALCSILRSQAKKGGWRGWGPSSGLWGTPVTGLQNIEILTVRCRSQECCLCWLDNVRISYFCDTVCVCVCVSVCVWVKKKWLWRRCQRHHPRITKHPHHAHMCTHTRTRMHTHTHAHLPLLNLLELLIPATRINAHAHACFNTHTHTRGEEQRKSGKQESVVEQTQL